MTLIYLIPMMGEVGWEIFNATPLMDRQIITNKMPNKGKNVTLDT